MDLKTALTWSSLNCLTKPRYDNLKSVFGDLDTALEKIDAEILRELGCKQETVERVLKQKETFNVDAYQKQLAACNPTSPRLRGAGVQLLTIEDDDYPSRLREIGDPPIFLYFKGDLSLLDQPCIALVGTRKMTDYGKRVTEHFVPGLVRAGMITISGLALGIDAEVAKQTMAAGGKTVAVLGNGLGLMYPKNNEKLAKEIVEYGGLLLSEFPLDLQPDKYTFPARNRIIAGLSLGTVVLEAAEESGAIITADLALDYGRDVFAVPGQIFDPNMTGCHSLISKGLARLVNNPEDILRELGIVATLEGTPSTFTPRNDEESIVFQALSTMPQKVDDIVARSGLDVGKVNATLTMMELGRGVKNVGSGLWVRV